MSPYRIPGEVPVEVEPKVRKPTSKGQKAQLKVLAHVIPLSLFILVMSHYWEKFSNNTQAGILISSIVFFLGYAASWIIRAETRG